MSTSGSEATIVPTHSASAPATPAAPAAETPTAPAKNRGGRPSNASKAAAAAAASAPAAKVDAPAAPVVVAPDAAPAPKPEDTVGGRKAAAAAEEGAAAAAEAIAAAPKAKTLDQVKAERRAKVAAEAAKGGAVAPAGDKPTDEAAAAAAKAAGTAEGEKTEEQKAADLAAKEDEDKTKAEAAKKKPETVETDIPADKLKEFTKLNRDLRDATTENRKLKADAVPLAESLKKAADLAKEGKHYDAIRALKAHGIDFDKAAAEVLRIQSEEADIDPETKKLRDELAAVTEKLSKLEDGQTQAQKDAQEAKSKAAKAQRESHEERIIAEVTIAAERFPYLAKDPTFVREALDTLDDEVDAKGNVVPGAYTLAVKHYGRQLDDKEKDLLLLSALETAEDRHAARAKLYGVRPRAAKPKDKPDDAAADTGAAAAASASPTTTDAGMRGTVTAIKPHKKRTLAEIKAERRAQGRR